MRKRSTSEDILLEEVTQSAKQIEKTMRNLSVGSFIKIIRTQLGMSQTALAKRAKVPQPAISKIEQGHLEIQLSTLKKILNALSCDLLLVPLLRQSTKSQRQQQARKKAKHQIDYLLGTMNLEKQKPDPKFINALLEEEEDQLLKGPGLKLWEDVND